MLIIIITEYKFLDAIMASYGKRMYEASQLLAKNKKEVCVKRKLFPEASTEANGRIEKVGKFYKNANTEKKKVYV